VLLRQSRLSTSTEPANDFPTENPINGSHTHALLVKMTVIANYAFAGAPSMDIGISLAFDD